MSTNDQLEQREKLELALLRAEHQKKFQMMINYIKEQVGDGAEYANSVARLVISDKGAYYELNDLPEEFSGAVGPGIEQSFIREEEAVALLGAAARAANTIDMDSTRQLQIVALYSRRGLVDRKNCFVVNYTNRTTSMPGHDVIGSYRQDVMPLFFKIKVDTNSDYVASELGASHGIIVCLVTQGDRYPLLRIRYDSSQTTDLTANTLSRSVQ